MAIVTLFGTNSYPRNKAETTQEHIILNENKEIEDAEMPVVKALPEEVTLPDRSVADLGLGSRITDILKGAGLATISDVLNQLKESDQAMLEINGFGPKSLKDLKDALTQMGYRLTGSSDQEPE